MHYEQREREVPLQVDQLVYLWACDSRGHHKNQEMWSSVVYQVINIPSCEGVVNTFITCSRSRKGKAYSS